MKEIERKYNETKKKKAGGGERGKIMMMMNIRKWK